MLHAGMSILCFEGFGPFSDFEYEFQIALMNRKLRPDIETLFLISDYRWLYISSTIVKTVASLGGDVRGLVPDHVLSCLRALRIHARRDRTRIAAARTGTLGTCALTGTGSVTRQGY